MFDKKIVDRFWSKVVLAGEDDCWLWKGSLSPKGYGSFATSVTSIASRVAVIIDGREIPEGMVVDHICKERSCVNPRHLRVATHFVNSVLNSDSPVGRNFRKTHCPRGHALVAGNLEAYDLTIGHRRCTICKRDSRRRQEIKKTRVRKSRAKGAVS